MSRQLSVSCWRSSQDLDAVQRWSCPHHHCAVCHRKTQAAGGLLFRCEVRSLADVSRHQLQMHMSCSTESSSRVLLFFSIAAGSHGLMPHSQHQVHCRAPAYLIAFAVCVASLVCDRRCARTRSARTTCPAMRTWRCTAAASRRWARSTPSRCGSRQLAAGSGSMNG